MSMPVDKSARRYYNKNIKQRTVNMKKANAYVTKMFILSIVLTVMFVGGIPAIILGATNEIWPLMGAGIGCTVVGFYAMPLAWISYGSARTLSRVVFAITDEHLYSVQEISAQLSMNEKDVRANIDKGFNKGFLKGYKREGDNIVLNENVAAGKREHFYECPYCGAKFTYTADNARCPYCGSPVNK